MPTSTNNITNDIQIIRIEGINNQFIIQLKINRSKLQFMDPTQYANNNSNVSPIWTSRIDVNHFVLAIINWPHSYHTLFGCFVSKKMQQCYTNWLNSLLVFALLMIETCTTRDCLKCKLLYLIIIWLPDYESIKLLHKLLFLCF